MSNGTPRPVWACGSKNISTWRTPCDARLREVGEREVAEVVGGDEHAHRRVVDGEEAGERVELVGRLDLLDGRLGQLDAVAAGELELQLGHERALEVQVQLALGQAGDELGQVDRGGVRCVHGRTVGAGYDRACEVSRSAQNRGVPADLSAHAVHPTVVVRRRGPRAPARAPRRPADRDEPRRAVVQRRGPPRHHDGRRLPRSVRGRHGDPDLPAGPGARPGVAGHRVRDGGHPAARPRAAHPRRAGPAAQQLGRPSAVRGDGGHRRLPVPGRPVAPATAEQLGGARTPSSRWPSASSRPPRSSPPWSSTR